MVLNHLSLFKMMAGEGKEEAIGQGKTGTARTNNWNSSTGKTRPETGTRYRYKGWTGEREKEGEGRWPAPNKHKRNQIFSLSHHSLSHSVRAH